MPLYGRKELSLCSSHQQKQTRDLRNSIQNSKNWSRRRQSLPYLTLHQARTRIRSVRSTTLNDDIAVKTANFIIDTAKMYHTDTIVFEHLDLAGKKHGSKKQKLHMWKAKYVQSMVTDKAHRLSMRISHICA